MTRIVVIGGGLAGLSAAIRCADSGAEVTLLETRPRLGGATWSFERDGAWFDNGQHVFLRCCTAYRAFLDRLGVSHLVRLQPRLDIPVISASGRPCRLRRNGLPAPLHLGASLARYHHLGRVERVRLLPAVAALRRVDPEAGWADGITFADWLRDHGQSQRAIEVLWDLITLPTVNLRAGEASLAMAAMVFRTGLLDRSDAADIGWARVPLGELHGQAAADVLRQLGATVHLRHPAEDLQVGEDGVYVPGPTGPAGFDAAVVAVPHDKVDQVLPRGLLDLPGRPPRQLGFSPIVNVNVVYDRPVTPEPVLAAVDSPIQWIFDHTEAGRVRDGQALTVSISAADAELGRPSAELAAAAVSELARLLPPARRAVVMSTVVSREGQATFRATPGQATRRPGTRTAHPRVALAGAWTATGWPATMEGAVRSGLAAAEVALRSVSQPRRLRLEASA